MILFGNGGLFKYVSKASKKWEKNEFIEKIMLQVYESKISNGEYVSEDIKDRVLANIENSNVFGDTFPLIVTVEGHKFI